MTYLPSWATVEFWLEMLSAEVAVAERAISFLSHTCIAAVFDIAIPKRHFES